MKKTIVFSAVAAALVLLAGCTTVESTQKFNGMGLGTPNEKAVCQTYVEIPGYYLFGLPIFVGSPRGDGEGTMFRNNLTTENVIYLLTKEAKARKAARVMNVQVTTDERFIFFGVTRRSIQASGTGVRTRGSALDTAAREYDSQP